MRWRGFRDDDGSIQWDSVRGHFRSQLWVAWFRLHNRWQDTRAVLAGACNASTWNPQKRDYDGGYNHWRCGKRRGHMANTLVTGHEDGRSGPHRFINYTWDGPGTKVKYAPMPIHQPGLARWFDTSAILPFMRLADGRKGVDTRRRARRRAETKRTWMENRTAQIRRAQDDPYAAYPD